LGNSGARGRMEFSARRADERPGGAGVRQALVSIGLGVVVLLSVGWVFGVTPGAVADGVFADSGEHPTNWLDAGLHPEGR